jgi:hypothetical protein
MFKLTKEALEILDLICLLFFKLLSRKKDGNRHDDENDLEQERMEACSFWANSEHIKCAINPCANCLDCQYFERKEF